MARRRLVFDIETDGLLDTVSLIWIIVTHDIDTNERKFFSDLDEEADGTIEEGLTYLFESDWICGHNIIGYDLIAIRKITGRKPKKTTKVVDTMLLSQVLNYKRFGIGHGLAKWGDFFGVPKPEHEDWSQYSKEMRHRCFEDVTINVNTYNHLMAELKSRKNAASLRIGLDSEHAVAKFCAECEYNGWPMDIKYMIEVRQQLVDQIEAIKNIIEPQLSLKVRAVDAAGEYKSPAWVRNGDYAARTASWFGYETKRGQEGDRPIWGDYTRVEVVQPDITSMESVKGLLFELGWKPTEWNWVKDKKTGKLVKSTPQLDSDSLALLGETGMAVDNYYTFRSRLSILDGWLGSMNLMTGRLHGSIFTIGTPTFRARHNGIANIPSVKAPFGIEFRKMFSCPEGFKIVGSDSSGNQLRGLAHYAGDPDFTKEIIEGDIHTFNGKIIEGVVGDLKGKAREIAKTFIYAFLYAGGDGKLGLIVTGRRDAQVGERLRRVFGQKVKGLSTLIDRTGSQYDRSFAALGKGYIQGLDGRPVYLEGKRLGLNYLLQSCEKITVSGAIMWGMAKLEEEGIEYWPLTWQHDEIQCMVHEADAERVAAIWKEAFREGPKLFGVNIMDGASKIGNNWYETH